MTVSAQWWPIIAVKFPDLPDDDYYKATISQLGAAFDSHEGKFVVLVDTIDMKAAPTATQRRMLNEFAAARHEETLDRALGTVFVVRSQFMRAALTAMDWIYKRPTPTDYKPRLTEGLEWCEERLYEAELERPDISSADLMALDSPTSIMPPNR